MSLTPKQEKFCQAIADGFYVYALCDPETHRRFYVGKGKGNRAKNHVRDCRSGIVHNGAKHEAIKAILDTGKEPHIEIIASGLSEVAALDREWREIQSDRENLTNIVHGEAPRSAKWDSIADELLDEIGPYDDWLKRACPQMLQVYDGCGGPKRFHAFLVEAANSVRL